MNRYTNKYEFRNIFDFRLLLIVNLHEIIFMKLSKLFNF